MKIQLLTVPFKCGSDTFPPLGPVTYVESDYIESLTELKEQGLWLIIMSSGAMYAITKEEFLKFDLLNTQRKEPIVVIPPREPSAPF